MTAAAFEKLFRIAIQSGLVKERRDFHRTRIGAAWRKGLRNARCEGLQAFVSGHDGSRRRQDRQAEGKNLQRQAFRHSYPVIV